MAHLYHNGSETPQPLSLLRPYTYDGGWPTQCRLKKESLLHLTFIVNRKWANVSLTLEAVRPFEGLEDDSRGGETVEGSPTKAQPFTKMLMGNYTLIFVITGSIQIKLENDPHSATVNEGETLVYNRNDHVTPVDISMIPLPWQGRQQGTHFLFF